MGKGRGPDFPLGHGHGGAVFMAAPLKGLVRQAVGHDTLSAAFHEDNRKAVKGFFTELRGGSQGDFLIRVAQPLTHAELQIPEACLGQFLCQLSNSVFSAHQGEDPSVFPKGGENVPVSAVKAHIDHIFIGGAQPGAQAHQAAESRLQSHLAAPQQGQQLFGAAVEADVPRHDHREPAALRMLFYGLHNFFRGDGFLPGLSGSGHALEHSSGADEAVRLRNGLGGSQGPVTSVSRADAHHRHLGRLPEVQLPAQHRRRLGKA